MTSSDLDTAIRQRIAQHLESSAEVKRQSIDACSQALEESVEILVTAFEGRKKLLLSGNGGSAADCQHMATEFVARLSHEFERPALSAIALTTDTSFITAYANDDHFDGIFERQIQGHGKPGDVLIAISTSGNSANILRGVQAAKSLGMKSIGLTGEGGGKLAALVDVLIAVPHTNTQFIQETHLAFEHLLCDLVEQRLFGVLKTRPKIGD